MRLAQILERKVSQMVRLGSIASWTELYTAGPRGCQSIFFAHRSVGVEQEGAEPNTKAGRSEQL
jgi:hypothetical protein